MNMAEQIEYKNPLGPRAGAADQVCDHSKIPTVVESVDIILGEEGVLTGEEDLDHLGQGMKSDDEQTNQKHENVLQVLTVWSMR